MTRIQRALASLTLTSLLAGSLSGCYGDAQPLAQDSVGPVDASAQPSAPGGTLTPAPDPADARYPPFEPTDYTYTLAVGCFCADGGTPMAITVVDGEVTEAVYSENGRGVQEGETAPDFRELTINDVIETANDPTLAFVDVTWPDDQDYPSVISIDRIAEAIDDEVTYFLSDVEVG